ncbi:unnamed protein product [Pylaiella littoralis]
MKEFVVAIDLGTSCTAYSWKSVADPHPAVGVPDMETCEDIIGKTPTTLLINGSTGSDRRFRSSGVEAYGRLAQRLYADGEIPHGAQLFKRFKMELHNSPSQQNYDDLLGAVTRSASKRAEMMLLDIFVAALQYIKSAALKRMTVTKKVTTRDVTWVLTVPVCCSEPAKNFMREAARKAGFISGGHDDESLVLCTEPIAACLALGESLTWKMKDKYLVIDCGGGTVDISAFKVVDPAVFHLEQIGKAEGGPWGSTNVDKQFEAYLKDFTLVAAQNAGGASLDSFFASSAMYRILQSWERAKISLKSVDASCRIDLSELSRMPLEVEMDDMDRGRTQKNTGEEEFVGGHGTWDLVLRPTLLRDFFKPQCDKIAQAVSEQLDTPQLQGLTSVVMVGGFSGSVHVQEAVKACVLQKYPNDSVNVAFATCPDLAIVQGAVHCVPLKQLQPSGGSGGQCSVSPAPQFKSIISANSYGVIVSEENARGVPSIFEPFFLKGEGYAMNTMVVKKYTVPSGEPFTLSIGSSANPGIHAGENLLSRIGGYRAMQKKEFKVNTSPPPVDTGGCCGRRRKQEPPRVDIFMEFTLTGIELHLRVKYSTGQVLFERTVPFVGF